MNSLEKQVWAAVFAKNWDEQPGRLKAASMSGFGPGTDWDAIRETSVDVGIMNADRAVMDLRKRIEERGSMHHDEDLELERREEIDDPFAGYSVIVEVASYIETSLACMKECEGILEERWPSLRSLVHAPQGAKGGVIVADDTEDGQVIFDTLRDVLRKHGWGKK